MGDSEGLTVGAFDGAVVVGTNVGTLEVGDIDGVSVGLSDGIDVGMRVGT